MLHGVTRASTRSARRSLEGRENVDQAIGKDQAGQGKAGVNDPVGSEAGSCPLLTSTCASGIQDRCVVAQSGRAQ